MSDLKAKHAFGSLANVDQAIADGKIDAYDILFLKDGDVARIGWIDKDGNKVIAQNKDQIIHVDELPTESGDENVVYIFEKHGYIWDKEKSKCIPLSEPTDVTEIKEKVDNFETAIKEVHSSLEIAEF
jgi:hypothetical protein|uniref:Uncharacterized protein n=1 Tax=virus sp. ctmTa7 TaxID=2828255 RepID=A0A8S5RCK3_9VIRU|nr:MAG TPA: hypothetical protein [virus sp. ctmTa7]DAU18417.1 MAG TPA: hypothetical protein [Bacteriophage sp.]